MCSLITLRAKAVHTLMSFPGVLPWFLSVSFVLSSVKQQNLLHWPVVYRAQASSFSWWRGGKKDACTNWKANTDRWLMPQLSYPSLRLPRSVHLPKLIGRLPVRVWVMPPLDIWSQRSVAVVKERRMSRAASQSDCFEEGKRGGGCHR